MSATNFQGGAVFWSNPAIPKEMGLKATRHPLKNPKNPTTTFVSLSPNFWNLLTQDVVEVESTNTKKGLDILMFKRSKRGQKIGRDPLTSLIQ